MPTAAIQRGSIETFAYVVKDDKTVTVRPVQLGPTEGETVAVTSGLKPGEVVVVVGGDKLREGTKVEIVTKRACPPSRSGARNIPHRILEGRSLKEGPIDHADSHHHSRSDDFLEQAPL